MGQHLPGPYAYDADDGSLQHAESGMEIASLSRVDDFPCRDTDKDRDFEAKIDATGRLLAAAPEMLAALQALITCSDDYKVYAASGVLGVAGASITELRKRSDEAMSAARAAIANAEGR